MTDLSSQHSRTISGEHLEVLGKRAAAMFVDGEVADLNKAVLGVVKEAGLSSEQVLRVIEFANTDAYLKEFKKEGMQHHVVNFTDGPADPNVVLKELNTSDMHVFFDRGSSDYHQPPQEKRSSVFAHHEEELFSKLAGSGAGEIPESNPLGAVMDLRDKFAGVHSHLSSQLSALETLHEDISNSLFNHVKQAALSGAPLIDIVLAWEQAAPDELYVKLAFDKISRPLIENEVFRDTSELVASLEKNASAQRINPGHPVVGLFDEFCQTLSKLAQVRQEQRDMAEGVGQLTRFIKEASLGGKVKEVYDVAKTHSRMGGAKAKELAHTMLGGEKGQLGHTVGNVAEGVISHAPELAAGVAGLEAYKNLAYNPQVQQAQRILYRNVPGSSAWDQHTQGIQAGVGDPYGQQYGGMY